MDATNKTLGLNTEADTPDLLEQVDKMNGNLASLIFLLQERILAKELNGAETSPPIPRSKPDDGSLGPAG